MPPKRSMPRQRAPRGRARHTFYVALLLVPVVALAVVLPFLADKETKLDGDLCPIDADAIGGRAVLLLDLRKPLGTSRNLPAELLRQVSVGIERDTELRVFALTADPLAPRMFLDRLCKPYDAAELAPSTAEDRRGEGRDCDEMLAQLPHRLRERAAGFCARREAIARRIDGLTAEPRGPTVPNAYLIEAIEDTRLELAQTPRPPALYIFSDMMQHAEWYSHPEAGPNGWHHADLARARQQAGTLVANPSPPDPDLEVTIFYAPRQGVTDQPRTIGAHKQFWRTYFAGTGPLKFVDQPTLPAYEVAQLVKDSNDDESRAAVPVRDQQPEQQHEQLATGPATLERWQVAADKAHEAESHAGDGPEQAEAAPVAPLPADPDTAHAATDDPAPAAAGTTVGPPQADATPAPPPVIHRDLVRDADRALSAAGSATGDPATGPDVGTRAGDPAPTAPGVGTTAVDDAQAPLDAPVPTPPAPDPAPPPTVAANNTEPTPATPARGLRADGPIDQGTDLPAQSVAAPTGDPLAIATVPNAAVPETGAAASFRDAIFEAGPCAVTLRGEFADVDSYPGDRNPNGRRPNYGAADIVVAYTIDQDGETVDADVAARLGRSRADRPRYMGLFARSAETAVRDWVFDFEASDGCTKRQQRVTVVRFRYRP